MKKLCMALALTLCGALLAAGAALAAPSPDHLKAAERYWTAAEFAKMIQESMDKMTARLPQAERAQFQQIGAKLLASGRIKKETVAAAAATFSAKELDAISDFYASPEGRAVMAKMPMFMTRVSRIVQSELVRLMEAARAKQKKAAPAPKAADKPTDKGQKK